METTQTNPTYPAWVLNNQLIIGAEGEESQDASSGSSEAEGGDDSSNDDENASGGTDSARDGKHDDADDPKVRGLKSALEKERRAATEREKELKELRKLKREKEARELEEMEEKDRLQLERDRAAEKAKRLAEGLLRRDLNSAITRAAQELKFIDPSDAISGVDLTALVYEQDEDDPSQVEIDEKSVKAAVKALLAKKPHFARSGTEDGQATGSQFGGKQKKGSLDLKELYPGL